MNWKRSLPVILSSCEQTLHELVNFSHVPAIVHKPLVVTEITNLKPALQIFLDRQLPNRVVRMVKREVPPETTRSSFLSKLASELAEEGLDHLEIVSLLYETRRACREIPRPHGSNGKAFAARGLCSPQTHSRRICCCLLCR